jgi:hypothetical protein
VGEEVRMTYRAITVLIKAQIETVSNVGMVYTELQNPKFWDAFYSKFKPTTGEELVRAWEIDRLGFKDEVTFLCGVGYSPTRDRTHRIQVRAHASFQEKESHDNDFQNMVELVVEALHDDPLLSGALLKPLTSVDVSVGRRMFGPVFCHYAELDFELTERVASS